MKRLLDEEIQAWIDNRFGLPNTVNIQVYRDITQVQLEQDKKDLAEWFHTEWKDMDNETATYWRKDIESLINEVNNDNRY